MALQNKKAALQVWLYDPEQVSPILAVALNEQAPDFEIQRFDEEDLLLEKLRNSECDALLLVGGVRVSSHLDLLSLLQTKYPRLLCLSIASKLWNGSQLARVADQSHRLFEYSPPPSRIVTAIQHLVRVSISIERPSMQNYIISLKKLPSPPENYRQMSEMLKSETTTAASIAELLEQDPAVAAKLLQLVNSSQFGLGRVVSRLDQAVSMIGLRALRGLVLLNHLSSQYEDAQNLINLSSLNQRSVKVARLAQLICKEMSLNSGLAEQAFIAGLMHRMGVVMMAEQNPNQYRSIIQIAQRKQRSLHVVEKALSGIFHGELTAALMSLWNLPSQAIEAVAFYAIPQVLSEDNFSPVTALHIADALVPGEGIIDQINLQGSFNVDYLRSVGVSAKLPRWRLIAQELEERCAS